MAKVRKCHYCGEDAHADVRLQRPSRKVGKTMAQVYKPRPICMSQKCWEAFWNEPV